MLHGVVELKDAWQDKNIGELVATDVMTTALLWFLDGVVTLEKERARYQ